jgi:hypothetical protein
MNNTPVNPNRRHVKPKQLKLNNNSNNNNWVNITKNNANPLMNRLRKLRTQPKLNNSSKNTVSKLKPYVRKSSLAYKTVKKNYNNKRNTLMRNSTQLVSLSKKKQTIMKFQQKSMIDRFYLNNLKRKIEQFVIRYNKNNDVSQSLKTYIDMITVSIDLNSELIQLLVNFNNVKPEINKTRDMIKNNERLRLFLKEQIKKNLPSHLQTDFENLHANKVSGIKPTKKARKSKKSTKRKSKKRRSKKQKTKGGFIGFLKSRSINDELGDIKEDFDNLMKLA